MGERDVREVLKRLYKEGWTGRAGRGSHRVFSKEGMHSIVVPTSKKELRKGTFEAIAKQAGWKDLS